MKNYKVRATIVSKENPKDLVESFDFDMEYSIMESHQTLGSALGAVLDENDIDADDLEHYNIIVELVER